MNRQQALAQLTAVDEPHELELVDVFGRQCRAFKNAPATLHDLFNESRSDETFIVYDDERYSFDEVYQQACKIAKLMTGQYGIKKGDRVAISMRNYPEWVMTYMAITSMGAIAVAMNALWTTEELEFGLTDSGTKLLFADAERIARVGSIYQALSVAVVAIRPDRQLPEDIPALNELLLTIDPCDMPVANIDPNDDATIMYTSGSTGHPKGAVSCHRNIITALMSWEVDAQAALLVTGTEPVEPDYQAATLLAVPLFHATGSHAVFLMCFRLQRRMVCMYKWDANIAAELIERERINSFVAPAAMTGDLLQVAQQTNLDLSSLAVVGGGGAPRAPEQVQGIADSFVNAMPNTGWGMTETNAIGAGIGGEDYVAHPGSSGRAACVLDLAIFDEANNELAVGERGELRVRGTSVIRGYWNRPEANAETFIDGWLKTGDVAYLDQEGYVYIVDRIKDLVIRGGENIGCAEVEAALLEHEHILEASVYAVPDERLGEEVAATVYATEEIDRETLNAFLSGHIARFKIPRYLDFSSKPLPRIASGKIDKKSIRELAVKALS